MGGNALKNCVTRRYDADEYHRAALSISDTLKRCFPESRPLVLKAYRNKESFGDLDILIDCETIPQDWDKVVEKVFNPKEMVKNSNVLSFECNQLQVDLIATDPSEMGTSYNYFNYNDLGNLLGRIAHSMGLKLGHDGLSYNWRIDTYQFKNEVISTNWEEICGVLGVSYERYMQGFDTLEDIFQFVSASPFFHSDIYLLENRNNYARTRDKKRKTYTEFLSWIQGHKHTEAQLVHKVVRDTQPKDVWLSIQFDKIKGFEDTYNRVQAEWAEAVEYKKRYSGDIVGEICGITGKELGLFMRWMRENHDQERMRKDILKFNPEVIPSWIKYWFGCYTNMKGRNYDEFNGIS